MESLADRAHKKQIESDHVAPDAAPAELPTPTRQLIDLCAERIRAAREQDRPVMIAFGAHTIKNGLAPVLNALLELRVATHLATNGAGIIHDWEFAYHGRSCENVEDMVRDGRFGNWQETGFYINLALNLGAYEGLGYGESIGALIENEQLLVPTREELRNVIRSGADDNPQRAAAAADLLYIVEAFELEPGPLAVAHPWKEFSVQAAAYRLGVPFTGHPMFGHDIIYNHPMNHGASVGRTAQRDFLAYAHSVSQLEGGVYLSIGSAVMSPMVFEKSLSIARNVAHREGRRIDDFFLLVVDLARSDWDWGQGEPPEENPAYYLRYNKSFSRMGGTMRYLQADNRDFLLGLLQTLNPGQ